MGIFTKPEMRRLENKAKAAIPYRRGRTVFIPAWNSTGSQIRLLARETKNLTARIKNYILQNIDKKCTSQFDYLLKQNWIEKHRLDDYLIIHHSETLDYFDSN